MRTEEIKLNGIEAKDIMREFRSTVGSNESLAKALSQMDQVNKYEIPVEDDGKVVGLISYAILAKRRNLPLSVPVESVMYSTPTISPTSRLPHVSEVLLTNDYLSVPIIEKGQLQGVVTRRDVIRKVLEKDIYTDIHVTDIMNTPVVTVMETADVSKALYEMDRLKERSLPVVNEEGRLVGIVALEDMDELLRAQRQRASLGERRGEKIPIQVEIKSVMLTPPISVHAESSLGEVMGAIVDNKISTVLVVDDAKPQGIVTGLDIIELISSAKPREEVLVQISGFDADDPYTYDSIYSVVEKFIPKLGYFVDPKVLNLHIKHHHHDDSMTKYTISARMSAAKKTFVTKKNDWELIKALHDAMSSLTKQAKKYKGKLLDEHHGGGERISP